MAAHTEDHVEPKKTLFIRNLPYTIDEKKLEEVFSDVGPVKKCFLVKDKDSGKCKGYGYVIYTMLEDAIEAKKTVKRVDGRNIFIVYADEGKKKIRGKRPNSQENPKPVKTTDGQDTENTDVPPAEENDIKSVTQPNEGHNKNQEDVTSQNSKYARAKTVVLTGFQDEPDSSMVNESIQNVKNVNKIIYPVKDRSVPTVILLFKSVRDSKRAVRRLDGRQFKGQTLHACQLSTEFSQGQPKVNLPKDGDSGRKQRQARLIIRNLSFKCTDDDLKKNFQKFGEITDAIIPKRNDGRQQGFGFVEFTDLSSADRAIQQMNMKQIKGRPVAVDWAVPKSAFLKEASKVPTQKQEVDSPDEGSFSGEAEENEDDIEDKEEDSDDEGFSDDENDEKAVDSYSDDTDDDDDDDDADDVGSSDEEDSDSENSFIKKKNVNLKSKKNELNAGRTVFIRNINFDSVEEELEEVMGEFGEMDYCKMVMDRFTEKPKGTAFVQYKTEESAQECLKKANEESVRGGIVLDGRRLNIIIAVSRQDAAKMALEGKAKEKDDKRNLYLAREGMIRPGTQAAIGLTKTDLDKRLKVEALKRQKLKNPNIFISPLRLCVRNIPVKTTDKELRQIFLKASGDKKAQITECRIMCDMSQVNAEGKPKSRGYGFVEFNKHDHALEALRQTNNNPDIFGDKRRPIVEFSLENKTALEAKAKRLERLKTKQESLRKEGNKTRVKQDKGKVSKNKMGLTKNKGDNLASGKKVDGDKVKRPKVMPSHFGPKIRNRNKGKQQPAQKSQDKESRKKLRARNDRKRHGDDSLDLKQPNMKKSKMGRREKTDDFDSMVNKYKNKILTASSKKGSKWFADN